MEDEAMIGGMMRSWQLLLTWLGLLPRPSTLDLSPVHGFDFEGWARREMARIDAEYIRLRADDLEKLAFWLWEPFGPPEKTATEIECERLTVRYYPYRSQVDITGNSVVGQFEISRR